MRITKYRAKVNLKRARGLLGLTLRQAGELAGISHQSIHCWETGFAEPVAGPGLAARAKLARQYTALAKQRAATDATWDVDISAFSDGVMWS